MRQGQQKSKRRASHGTIYCIRRLAMTRLDRASGSFQDSMTCSPSSSCSSSSCFLSASMTPAAEATFLSEGEALWRSAVFSVGEKLRHVHHNIPSGAPPQISAAVESNLGRAKRCLADVPNGACGVVGLALRVLRRLCLVRESRWSISNSNGNSSGAYGNALACQSFTPLRGPSAMPEDLQATAARAMRLRATAAVLRGNAIGQTAILPSTPSSLLMHHQSNENSNACTSSSTTASMRPSVLPRAMADFAARAAV